MKLAQLKLVKELQVMVLAALDAKRYSDVVFGAMLLPDKEVLLNMLQHAGRIPEAACLAQSLENKGTADELISVWKGLLHKDKGNSIK
jgi:hypothetical protein